MNYIAKLFMEHQVVKTKRLLQEGVDVKEITEILKEDFNFFKNNVLKVR